MSITFFKISWSSFYFYINYYPYFHASNSLIGSVTVIAGLYILLWGKDKEMQNQEKSVQVQETEELKDQETEFQVIKISVELEHP